MANELFKDMFVLGTRDGFIRHSQGVEFVRDFRVFRGSRDFGKLEIGNAVINRGHDG